MEYGSRGSAPAMNGIMSRISATDRAIGPTATSVFQASADGSRGTAPNVGLNPTTPQNADGIRMDPPPSPPIEIGPIPAATAAPAPPDDPPGVRARSHGLEVRPLIGDSVMPV